MVWSSEMLDTLIDFIAKNPFLYDYSNPEYYNKGAVFSSWNFIGQKLGEKGFRVRTIWTQLVKIYSWIHNNDQYTLDEDCYWPYLEKLKFLKPIVGDNIVEMNMSYGEELIDYEASLEVGMPVAAFIKYKTHTADAVNSENVGSSPVQNDKNFSLLESPFTSQEKKNFSSHRLPHSPFPASLNGLAMQKNLEIEEALCQYLRKKVAKVKDPNELFLTSVAHDMKMLSSRDQAVFKMKVQQLLVEMVSQNNNGEMM